MMSEHGAYHRVATIIREEAAAAQAQREQDVRRLVACALRYFTELDADDSLAAQEEAERELRLSLRPFEVKP